MKKHDFGNLLNGFICFYELTLHMLKTRGWLHMEECKSGHVVVLCVANYVVTSDCYLSTSACV